MVDDRVTIEMSTYLKSRNGEQTLWGYVAAARHQIEPALLLHLPIIPAGIYKPFNAAMHYALFPGGKRLRPVLTMLGAEVVGGNAHDVLTAAVAVEYLHTSSLIFDDLPCMDDAAERRGRAALHMRYGEGIAILVALALMNASYGLISGGTKAVARNAAAHNEVVECIGSHGMIAGQYLDMSSVAPTASGVGIGGACNLKTSALIRLSLRIGAILSGATAEQLEALRRFAGLLGDAYQLSDDILDIKEDASLTLTIQRRPTAVMDKGMEDAKRSLSILLEEAKTTVLTTFDSNPASSLLCDITDYMGERSW